MEFKILTRRLIPSILHLNLPFLKLKRIITNRVQPQFPGKSAFSQLRFARKTLSFTILRLFRHRKIVGQ